MYCPVRVKYQQKGEWHMSTEAKRKANSRYISSLDNITIRVPKGTKDLWRAAAAAMGKSLNQMIADAVEAELRRKA